ncbi:hypothetical protein ONO86_00584 [Micromonospora noduli]|nr:hypothetical protein ONO86_00584 [Micromonospora noduli]
MARHRGAGRRPAAGALRPAHRLGQVGCLLRGHRPAPGPRAGPPGRADRHRLAAAGVDAQPGRGRRAGRHPGPHDQLGEPRRVGRDHRRDPDRRGGRAADQPGTPQQPGFPRRRPAEVGRHHRPAGGRRGALRLRLGARLPTGLPAAADVPRRTARAHPCAGDHRHRERPGHPGCRRAAGRCPHPARHPGPRVAAPRGARPAQPGAPAGLARRPPGPTARLGHRLHADRGGSGGDGRVPALPGLPGRLVQRAVRRRRPPGRRTGPARQQDQGIGRHQRPRHGLRQARPGLRRPPRRATLADRVLPAGRPRGPRRRARRGAAAARRRGRRDLALLRLARVPTGAAGPGRAGRPAHRPPALHPGARTPRRPAPGPVGADAQGARRGRRGPPGARWLARHRRAVGLRRGPVAPRRRGAHRRATGHAGVRDDVRLPDAVSTGTPGRHRGG